MAYIAPLVKVEKDALLAHSLQAQRSSSLNNKQCTCALTLDTTHLGVYSLNAPETEQGAIHVQHLHSLT